MAKSSVYDARYHECARLFGDMEVLTTNFLNDDLKTFWKGKSAKGFMIKLYALVEQIKDYGSMDMTTLSVIGQYYTKIDDYKTEIYNLKQEDITVKADMQKALSKDNTSKYNKLNGRHKVIQLQIQNAEKKIKECQNYIDTKVTQLKNGVRF